MNKTTTIWACICFIILPTSIYWQIGKPFNPHTLAMYSGPGVYLTDIIIIPLVILMVTSSIIRFKQREIIGKPFPLWLISPFILLMGWAVISALFAISREVAFYYLSRWVLGLLFVLSILLMDVKTSTLIKWFVLGLCGQSGLAALQFMVNGPLHIPGELTLAIDQPRAAIVNILGNQHIRTFGLTFHPNVLGGFLLVAIFLTFYLLLWHSRRWILALPVLFAGLILSFSRSAWLAFALSLGLFGLFSLVNKKSPALKRLTLFGLLPILVMGIVGGLLTNRFNLQSLAEFTSLFGRGELIQIAMNGIVNHPLLGIGPGNFPLFMLQYRTLDPPHFVHNVPLLLASEVGLLGGIIWYWLWIKPLTLLRRAELASDPLFLSLICAWMGICIIGLFDSYPWNLESGRLLSLSLLAWIGKTSLQPYLAERTI